MGWASYFEDICHQREESAHSTTIAFIGPAGNAPPQLSPPLVASYDRLRSHYDTINRDVIDKYERGQWLILSQEMDTLQQEVCHFNTNTLMAGRERMLSKADSLSKRLQSVLVRGRSVITYLDSMLSNVLRELENIQRLKRDIRDPPIPRRDRQLERNAFCLFHGWKALTTQIQHLEQQASDLQIKLIGDVFERVMTHPTTKILDKDNDEKSK